jgi:rubrerythrin
MLPAMRLDPMLERCAKLEERAAAVYRSYAAASRDEPTLCALWTGLAREEEEHADSMRRAKSHREASTGWRTRIDGWDEALADVEARLTAAEQLGAGASASRQLSAALDLEMTELDVFRHVLLAVSREPDKDAPESHAERLVEAATRLSDDPHIKMQAALLHARARVKERS